VDDLLRYAQAHLGDALLLSTESQTCMQEPQASVVADDERICLTWFTNALSDGTRVIRHSGGTNGQIAGFWIVPARRFALAVLTNAGNGGMLTRELYLQAVRDYLGLDDGAPAPIDVPPERLEAVTGRYTGALQDLVVELGERGLIARAIPKGGFPHADSPPPPAPAPAPFAFYSESCVVVTEGGFKGARGEFGGWQNGRPAWLRFGARARLRSE
jgi:hypothetical protein